MNIRQWFVAGLVVTVAACESAGSDPLVLQSGGNYSYEAYAPSGARVLQGIIHLEWPITSTIDRSDMPIIGTWSIHWVPGADQQTAVGGQVGEGTLVGRVGEEGLALDLNPANADDNVTLHAIVRGNTLLGNWTWSSLTGPTTKGRFTAAPGR